MKRLKALGLLAMMALALTAIGGATFASASVSGFEVDDESGKPALLKGKGGEIVLSVGLTVRCASPTFQITGGSDYLSPISTDTATAQSCSSGSLALNGCQFIFRPGAEKSKGTFEGSIEIGGGSCSGMTAETTAGGVKCKNTIPPQTGINATYTNVAGGFSEEINILAGDSFEYVGPGGASCKSGAQVGGWSSEWNVTAFNFASEGVDLRVGLPPTGFYLSGGEFQAESYPLAVSGAQSEHTFTMVPNAPKTECATTSFSANLPSAGATLSPLSAEYVSCLYSGAKFNAAVKMNSCYYILHAAGTVDVACSKEGDSISVEAFQSEGSLLCANAITPQTGLKGVAFTTVGEGNERGLKASFTVEGLAFTVVKGAIACGTKTGEKRTNAKYTGSVTLKLTN
jgi:hypothetical protein